MTSDLTAFNLLQGALQAADLRQQVYANNIANVDTPGYKRQDVVFEDLLQSQMQQAPPAQMGVQQMAIPQPGNSNLAAVSQIQPEVITDSSSAIQNNGNNVDINNEMTLLAENQIRYNALINDLKLRFSRTQAAIGGQ